MFSRTAVYTSCPPCPSDSQVARNYAGLVRALQTFFGEKSSTEPVEEIKKPVTSGKIKGLCRFCNDPVYDDYDWKRGWPNFPRYSHGNTKDDCDLWKAKIEQDTTAKEKHRRTSWKVWKFIEINPLTIMTLCILVLILVILNMAGVLIPMLVFMWSILEGLWTLFLDLFKGMLCPCGKDDWVPADIAEGYVNKITRLEQDNMDLQRQLNWAKTQQNHVPDPPVDNTAQTPEPATTSMSGAMLVAMNMATAVVTGTGCLLAYWAVGANPELGTATGMSMPGMAAQERASARQA